MYGAVNLVVLIAGLAFAVYILWLGFFRRNTLMKRLGPLAAALGVLVIARILIDVTLF